MINPPSEPLSPTAANRIQANPLGVPNGPVRKIIALVVLLLATLFAGLLISGVIEERENRQSEMYDDFNQSWGPKQGLRSPILVIPYQTAADQPRLYLKIAPSRLQASIPLLPEDRKRGLFHATVYGATADLQGRFVIPSDAKLAELTEKTGILLWADSFVMLETSDLSGLSPNDRFTWNGEDLPWQNCRELAVRGDDCETPMAKSAAVVLAHPHLTQAPAAGSAIPFHATLGIRGTGAFHMLFQGRDLEAVITAPWPTPSFTGSLLPSSSIVTDQGFEAHWQAVNYTAPQIWSSKHIAEMLPSGVTTAGVALLEATPTYRMINRASKYNILFVVLCFTTYFLFEIFTRVRIHTIQYGLLGASLTLFPLLLVSLAEPLGYDLGYALSAALVLGQASLYTATVARRRLQAGLFAALLASLFGFLYVLLSLETYSLLVGSAALFVALSTVMGLTRRVDWSTGTAA